ncbi:hypothetical protein D3C71_1694610 [compost metagenome]
MAYLRTCAAHAASGRTGHQAWKAGNSDNRHESILLRFAVEGALDGYLPLLGGDFGVSTLNSALELADHCEPSINHSDAAFKLAFEGDESICEIATGSGLGFGPCPGCGLPAGGAVTQPLVLSSTPISVSSSPSFCPSQLFEFFDVFGFVGV